MLFFVGLLCHTYKPPLLWHKYSIMALIALTLVGAGFFVFRALVRFTFSSGPVTLKNGKQVCLSPRFKVMYILFLLALLLVPMEVHLRRQHRPIAKDIRIESFHPFLQTKLSVHRTDLPVNTHGFRGEDISKIKPNNTFRIFLIGGSSILSERVAFDHSHARCLEKSLRAYYPDRRIEVQNAGGNWHTSEHTLIKYLFHIKDFSPDMIIVWHAINDMHYSFVPPEYSRGSFESDYSHFYGALSNMVFDRFVKQDLPFPITINLKIFTAAKGFCWNVLYSDFREQPPKPHPGRVTALPSLASFNRNMKSLAKITNHDGVKLVLASQPTLFRPGLGKQERLSIWFPHSFIDPNNIYPDMDSMIAGIRAFNETTKRIAGEYGIPFIDLASKIPRTREYFFDDCHYTIKGNALIAQELFMFIAHNQLIE